MAERRNEDVRGRKDDPTAPHQTAVRKVEGQVPPGSEEALLGRAPRINEPERPATGESSSQPPPGASGPHANPIGPGMATAHPVTFAPGEVLAPRRTPDMTPTGAAQGQHPPALPYDGRERRMAQQDWDRWRAEERRQRPFTYPEWRS